MLGLAANHYTRSLLLYEYTWVYLHSFFIVRTIYIMGTSPGSARSAAERRGRDTVNYTGPALHAR